MRLKNKKTGEICDFKIIADYDDCTSGWRLEKHDGTVLFYDHIDEIHSEWENYKEPKPQVVYYIDRDGEIVPYRNIKYPKRVFNTEQNKEIGNYFETREEAELAVRKLKAWKRLKDKGFVFCGTDCVNKNNVIYFEFGGRPLIQSEVDEAERELDICFGGEE